MKHPRIWIFGISLGLTLAIGTAMALDPFQALAKMCDDCASAQCGGSCGLGDF